MIKTTKKQLPQKILELMKKEKNVLISGSFHTITKRAEYYFMKYYLDLTEKHNIDRYSMLERYDLNSSEIGGVENIIRHDLGRIERFRGLLFYMDSFDNDVAAISLIIPKEKISLVSKFDDTMFDPAEGWIIKRATSKGYDTSWYFEFMEFDKKGRSTEIVTFEQEEESICGIRYNKAKRIL